jgi:hypothetical protein
MFIFFYWTGVYKLLSNNELLIRFACADNEFFKYFGAFCHVECWKVTFQRILVRQLSCLCSPRGERKLFLNVGRVLPMDTPLCSTRFESSLCIFTEVCTVTVCFVGKSTDLISVLFGFPSPPEKCVLSSCVLHMLDFLEHTVFNRLFFFLAFCWLFSS